MAIDTIERRTSRPSDDGRRVSGRDVSTCWPPAEYEASDSEHEQPAWQVPIGAGRRTEREASTSSSESESSDGGIDDDSLLERMAAAARRGARRMARRNAIGHRATRRVERHGGLPLATIQQRWDLAMTMPKASADGVRAYDDDSTRTGATRGGDVAQGKGGRIELPVAEEVGHARSKVSGHSASGAGRVRFGEDADAARADCPPGSERGGLRFDARQHNVECQLSAQRAFKQTTAFPRGSLVDK